MSVELLQVHGSHRYNEKHFSNNPTARRPAWRKPLRIMRHPYQCLATATLAGPDSRQVLVAACGSQICVYDLPTKTLLAIWPAGESKEDGQESNSSTEIITASSDRDHRPRKRRKKSARQNGDAPAAAITNLLISQNARHLVASTGEDKFIHVIEINVDGQLQHLSQRRMTKRPCAITLTPKNDFILVGDKFGDVYALPLHFHESDLATAQVSAKSNGSNLAPQPFKPSASNLTVHTERNLKALKNQLQQAQLRPAKVKDAMEFPHELILGHVSMLTDILSGSLPSPKTASLDREYIITSDRDEHIRVSRGHSQAHVIENYCFGHAQFVNKLCLARPDILVSGGGDGQLFVWDWCRGQLLGTLPLLEAAQRYRPTKQASGGGSILEPIDELYEGQPSQDGDLDDTDKELIAVTGIRAKPHNEGTSITIYCICEALAAIFEFTFKLGGDRHLEPDSISLKTYDLPGNPIDITFLDDRMVLSVDTAHEKGSLTERRKPVRADSQRSRLLWSALNSELEFQPLDLGNEQGEELTEEGQFKKVKDLLYGVGNLRKHSNEDVEQ